MPKHSEQFNTARSPDETARACVEGLRALGWQVAQSGGGLVANEAPNPLSMHWPAQLDIRFAPDAGGGTRVAVNGSIAGFGPLQSGHLKDAMGRFRAAAEQAASRTSARADAAPQTAGGAAAGAVVVNGVPLDDAVLRQLQSVFRAAVPHGSYWYDRVSGAWGRQGGPALGLTLPGLEIGGPLRADASNGNTGVFVNGRELHLLDVLGLQQIAGAVAPGRYWIDAQGNGGYEGGPALFNLALMAQQAAAARGGLWRQPGSAGVGESYGGGAWAYGNANTGIGVLSDGEGGMMIFNR
jgi:hypothetical protein